ncbi:MAG: hypothetical protein KGJ31_03575 [Patescibacteria group bacterium]|nr:hypothetical protein [Patescibacteria group bacterium]
MALPADDTSYSKRQEATRDGLYRILRQCYGLGGNAEKLESHLVIAPVSQWREFQCPLMPPHLSAFPSAYVNGVTLEQEIVLLGEVGERRDPGSVEIFRQTIGDANLDFFMHMFGFGEYRHPCIPRWAMVEACRVLSHDRWGEYLLVDGMFSLSGPEVGLAIV